MSGVLYYVLKWQHRASLLSIHPVSTFASMPEIGSTAERVSCSRGLCRPSVCYGRGGPVSIPPPTTGLKSPSWPEVVRLEFFWFVSYSGRTPLSCSVHVVRISVSLDVSYFRVYVWLQLCKTFCRLTGHLGCCSRGPSKGISCRPSRKTYVFTAPSFGFPPRADGNEVLGAPGVAF